jgi:hypothetical protein
MYIFYEFFNVFNLTNYCFYFILFNKFYVFVDFYYKLILINKFSKHSRVNGPCCAYKYLDLYLSLNFFSFVFVYCQKKFIELF